jgi:hypothetical protein
LYRRVAAPDVGLVERMATQVSSQDVSMPSVVKVRALHLAERTKAVGRG